MHLHIYIHTYIYILYTHAHTHEHTHTHTRTHTHTHIYMYVYTYIYVYICINKISSEGCKWKLAQIEAGASNSKLALARYTFDHECAFGHALAPLAPERFFFPALIFCLGCSGACSIYSIGGCYTCYIVYYTIVLHSVLDANFGI